MFANAMSVQNDERRFSTATLRVVLICWFTIIFEGYDLVVYGTVAPTLLNYKPWTLNPALIGAISSSIVVGMAIGALFVGFMTDQLGRRKTLIGSLLIFSVANALCGFAPTPLVFVIFRFIGGIGLGGFLPTATAITVEYTPRRYRMLTYTLMFSGYGVGGIAAALLAIPLVPAFGWQIMFWLNAVVCFLVAPVAYFFLPESIGFLLSRNRLTEAQHVAEHYHLPLEEEQRIWRAQHEAMVSSEKGLSALRTLFSSNYLVATIIFAVVTFFTLFMVFGVNTWLPQLMKLSGYSLQSSLVFIAVLNLGNMVGNVIAGGAADRYGPRNVCIVLFILAAISFFLLSFKVPLILAFVLVILIGNGTLGAQNLINVYVASHYPTTSRASAVGWALGAGRIGGLLGPNVVGLLQLWQFPLQWSFYVLAIPALLSAVALLFLSGSYRTQSSASAQPQVAEGDSAAQETSLDGAMDPAETVLKPEAPTIE